MKLSLPSEFYLSYFFLRFEKQSYTAFVPERNKGSKILKVTAIDSDLDSSLRYSLIEPVIAMTKAGFKLDPTNFNYNSVFKIDETSGEISLQKNLENSGLYSVTLTVKAEDLNAMDGKEQIATCEVIFYVQSHKESGPIFLNEGWNNIEKKIHVNIIEESEVGNVVIEFQAEDPVTQEQIYDFEIEPSDGFGYFRLINDKVVIERPVDYESVDKTVFTLEVKAISQLSNSFSTSHLIIEVINTNDNSPVFDKESYKAAVLESIKHPERILVVKAVDNDAVRNDLDIDLGYSKIKYYLIGPSESLFMISQNGEIMLRENQTLDREKQAVIKLQVVAEDSLGQPSVAHKTIANVTIEVLMSTMNGQSS